MKKGIGIGLLAVIIGFGMHFSRTPGERSDANLTELLYWGLDQDVYILEVLQEFERRHPDIRVVFGQSAAINRVADPQRILCSIAGGFPPDVIEFDRFAVGEMASRGAFEPLQPFLERDLRERPDDPLTIRPENYYEPTWAEASLDGTLYAIPIGTDNRALYYNKVLLKRAGFVDADGEARPPDTWEELAEMAVALSEFRERGESRSGLRTAGFLPNWGNSWLYMYGWMNGARFMSEDGRTCLLNEPAVVEALDYIVKIYDSLGGAEETNKFQSTFQGGELDPFLTGRVAMRIDGNYLINIIAAYNPELEFGVAAPPIPAARLAAGHPKISWSGGFAWIMPRGCRHPEAAWELIRFMASPEAQRIRAEAERTVAVARGQVYIPGMNANRIVLEELYERYILNEPTIAQKFKDGFRTHVDLLPVSHFRPVTPVGQMLWNEHVRATELAMYHDASGKPAAAEALDRCAAVVQKELDRLFTPSDKPVLPWSAVLAGYVVLIGGLVLGVGIAHRRRSRVHGYFRREYRAGVLFALPWIFGFVIFTGGPIVFSAIISFTDYDILTPPRFTGLDHYAALLGEDPLFWKSLWNTLYMMAGIPLGMAAGLGVALLLNHEIRGMAVYRTLFYLPAIMPAVAASILWIWIFNPTHGILNTMLGWVGMPQPGWLQNQIFSKPSLILMGLWGAGASMIIWLAGLKGIPDHLYDASKVDGANAIQRFAHVTLPMLSPYVLFNLIMGVIGTFQVFTQAYVMTQGGPNDTTLFYVYYLFNNAFRYLKMGYASAMAWILFVIILILTLVQLRWSRRWVHYTAE